MKARRVQGRQQLRRLQQIRRLVGQEVVSNSISKAPINVTRRPVTAQLVSAFICSPGWTTVTLF